MSSGQMQSHLLLALRRILRSLTRLLIRIGIRFDEFDAITRDVYVESAIRDCAHPGIPSRERIAALTGLTRRQVDYCIDGGEDATVTDPTVMALLVEVLHKWHTVPGYGGPYGIPLELEFESPPGRCIRNLVTLVNPKANAQAVLDELLRSGAILPAGQNRFRPASRTFMMPDPTSPKLIEWFGITLSRLTATLEYNMNLGRAERRLERRVYADRGLAAELVPAFEDYADTKVSDFLLELDNWLASHSGKDVDAADMDHQVEVGVGIFLYIEPLAAPKEPLASLVDSD